MLITLDHLLAQQAAEAAAQHRLRGSNAVYAVVALRNHLYYNLCAPSYFEPAITGLA